MNKIIKHAGILFLICAVTAGVLGLVDFITQDKIAEQKAAKTMRAYASVLPADGYEEVPFDGEDPVFAHVDRIVKASGGEGYVVLSSFAGAQGLITMATGVSNEFLCTGISIISNSETSGLGGNAASNNEVGIAFRSQFIGQSEEAALAKNGGEIDALTGATVTSSAVTNGVAEAVRAVKTLAS